MLQLHPDPPEVPMPMHKVTAQSAFKIMNDVKEKG